jgi:basic membrane protein A
LRGRKEYKMHRTYRRGGWSLLLALTVTLAMLAGGCGSESVSTTSPTNTVEDTKPAVEDTESAVEDTESAGMKVALLVAGVTTDLGFFQVVFDAAKAAADAGGHELAVTERVEAAQAVEALRGYARDGFDLVIGAGEEFTAPAIEVGSEFPDTWFGVINGNDSAENVASFVIDQMALGYLSGVLAATDSKTGVVGVINALEFESTARLLAGFEQGVADTSADVKVLSVYTGDFNDPALGKAAAAAMIDEGADVLVNALDLGAQGVIEAAQEGDGVHLIGFFSDQAAGFEVPELYFTSAIASWPAATKNLIEIAASGEIQGQVYVLDVKDERFAYLAPYGPDVSDEAKALVDETLSDIRAGTLVFP